VRGTLYTRRVQPTRRDVSQFIYFYKMLYLLLACRLAAGSSIGLTNT